MKKCPLGDFPGGPVVRTLRLQGVWVWSLGELRSHMPCCTAKTGSVPFPCCQAQQTQLCLPHSPPLSCVQHKLPLSPAGFSSLGFRSPFLSHLRTYFALPFAPTWGILIPQPGIEPASPALEVQSLNHWTTREVPHMCLYPFTWLDLPDP